MKLLTAHLEEVDETYLQHMGHALRFAARMVAGGVACFVHALLPFLFVRTGSECIESLHDQMVTNRKDLTPKSRWPSVKSHSGGHSDGHSDRHSDGHSGAARA